MMPVAVTAVFLTLLALAAALDVRERRVPNWLVVMLMAIGLAAALLRVSIAASLINALLGILVGLAVWVPFWLLGLLGAGDVKFFAAASAWLGPSLSWRASLGVALLGGLLGAALLVARRGVKGSAEFGLFTLTNSRAIIHGADVGGASGTVRTFPYAVPMAIVAAAAVFYPQLF